MGNFELNSGEEMLLNEQHYRAHKRMWAAVNMNVFANRLDWTEEERDMIVSMLGLEQETQWVTESQQQKS